MHLVRDVKVSTTDRIKAVPKSKFPSGLGGKKGLADPN